MQNHVRNIMLFRKRSCDEGLQSYRRFRVQVQTGKDRKLNNIHFSSVCEQDESPCTL